MPIEPQYELLEDFYDIAKKVVEKYRERFEVDISTIRPVAITNKDRPDSRSQLWQIERVKQPVRMDCQYSHYVILFYSDWEIMSDKHKNLLVAQILHAIPVDELGHPEEGKINSFDLKDFATMVRTFGPDYLVDDDVPDILKENITWKD